MTLAQAPPSLRAAVLKSLGTDGSSAPRLKQHAELTASDSAQGDEFGFSVAVSGSTAVVGAPFHDSATGAAYVFVRSGSKWSQQAELTAADGAPSDDFGRSVAVSGLTAVVGALGHKAYTGAAYVFVRSGTKWSEQAELTAADGAQGDYFGFSVAVAGSTAVLGAPFHNSSTGAVYVFLRSGTKWSQQAELTGSDAAAGDEVGFSVSVSTTGSTALAGAPNHNTYTGAAYVLVRSGTTWSQQAELTASNGTQGDNFGYSVAVSRTTAVVGAPVRDLSTGATYAFARSGSTWSQQAELSAPDIAQGDEFGFSVAVSTTGSTALAGAPSHNTYTGAAYMFVRSGTTWTKRAKLTATDGVSEDALGSWVAVSSTSALVGAPGHNTDTGAAYVFTLP